MSRTGELERFYSDLKANETLRENMEEACRRISKEGRLHSDGEVYVAAARELGYDFTITELEQAMAEREALDAEALKSITAGVVIHQENCDHDYVCDMSYGSMREDEYGHDDWCVAAWHCFTVALHTESKEDSISCWSNYACGIAWKH